MPGRVEQGFRCLVCREVQAAAAEAVIARAAIAGQRIEAAIFMAMLVMQGEAVAFAVNHPDAGTIFADMQRDSDLVLRAGADMHDNALRAPGIVLQIIADDLAFEGLAAEGGQALHELRLLKRRLAAGGHQQQRGGEKTGTHRVWPSDGSGACR
jgi:hypothetical protein